MSSGIENTTVVAKPVVRSFGRRLLRMLLLVVATYVCCLVVLMWFENSMIFPAPRYPVGDWEQTQVAVEDARFEASDGTRLHGWYVEHPDARGTLLYLHGNGENVAQQTYLLKRLRDTYQLNVLVFDYRGYGKSEGSPNEKGVKLDAQAALAWLNQRTGTRPDEVIFFGRSLGAVVGVDLAGQVGCRGLVLHSGFSSLTDVAAWHFPWFPVRWMLRNRFPACEQIERCSQPLLQAHGDADSLAPLWSAEKLFAASPSSNKQLLIMRGHDHNDDFGDEFWHAFGEFLQRLPASSKKP